MASSPLWRFEPTLIAPTAPQCIGQYDLIEPLGRGGMGVVWKGIHRHLGQRVAIKFLAPDSLADPQAVARFYREMRAVGRVSHPNLVRALDAGEYDGHHVLVMECVDGLTVRDLLAASGPLPVAAACEIVRQAALGLSAIAAAGMVHRDLKPSNLFLTTEGTVKILDLGLARLQVDSDDRELTISGNLLGTIDYMAPEQSQDPRSVDVRSDLYSLGCTLYAILTGSAPFAGQRSSLEARLRAHREESPPDVKLLRCDVPPALSDVIAALLAKSPADRIGSAEELAASLAAFASAESLVELARQASSAANFGRESNPSTHRGDTARPGAGSGAETSEVPVPADTKTPRESTRARKLPAASRGTRVRIAAAVGALLVASLAAFGFSHWRDRPLPAGQPSSSDGSVDQSAAVVHPDVDALEAGLPVVHDFTRAASLVWHDLLERRPTPVYWQAGEGLADWDWQPERSQLIVRNNDRGLLSLGRLDAEDYMLQIGIHQNGWPGGIGVFFGLENWNPQSESPGWHCYQLTMHQVANSQGARTNLVEFSRLETAAGVDRTVVFHPTSLASATVRRPVGEAMLELTVKRGRLVRALFDGIELRDLLESVNEITPQVKWSGGLGVSVDGGDATIRKARLMVLEGAARGKP